MGIAFLTLSVEMKRAFPYSSALGNLAFYPCRLLAFMLIGMALREFSLHHASARRTALEVNNALLLFVGLSAILHYWQPIDLFYCDGIFALSISLAAAYGRLTLSDRAKKVAMILGTTSLSVYLVHPLFTAAIHCAIKKLGYPLPYGVMVVVTAWLAAWLFSFAFAFMIEIIKTRRFF